MSAAAATGLRLLRPIGRGARSAAKLPPRQQLALLALVAVVLGGGYMWLRSSSLVAVDEVTVKGAGGEAKLVDALTEAGEGMSTLSVDADRLAEVAKGFPSVESIHADASLPSSLTVTVKLRHPVAYAHGPDGKVAVAADGTALPTAETKDLPALPGSGVLGGEPGEDEVAILSVLGAAPPELLGIVIEVAHDPTYGPVLTLEPGIELRFTRAQKARDKWRAAAAVLADPALEEAAYIDLTVPSRPAVGGAGGVEAVSTVEPQVPPEGAAITPSLE